MKLKSILKSIFYFMKERISIFRLNKNEIERINLCCGDQKIPGYLGIDMSLSADLYLNLQKARLPFNSNSLKSVVCISGINYFTRANAVEIIAETYRVLKTRGIARFATQDLETIAKRYVQKDKSFFFQTLPSGKERFEGVTFGDKFNSWFYGYLTAGGTSKYFYDFDTLQKIFVEAGFSSVENKGYMVSQLENIKFIDNRPDQMFFLEAIK